MPDRKPRVTAAIRSICWSKLCAWAFAEAHARSGDSVCIAGYMGSSDVLGDAITGFAVEYPNQTERDHWAFIKGAGEGRIKATPEV